jgi:hypothetical protein
MNLWINLSIPISKNNNNRWEFRNRKSIVNRFCRENITTAFADIVAPPEKIEGSLFFRGNPNVA